MAAPKALDLWIVETNQVYHQVPFTTVVDWIQQGRLLEEDQVSPAGAKKWVVIGKTKLSAYLPRADEQRVEDQAEALEPVEVDFQWKKPVDEDDDIDMIPLIDISLVLLIFFMMTASVVTSANRIDVPATKHGSFFSGPGTIWIGIDRIENAPPRYSLGQGEKGAEPEDLNLSEAELLAKLEKLLKAQSEPVELRIAADKRLPGEVVMRMTTHLEKYRRAGLVRNIRGEVNEIK